MHLLIYVILFLGTWSVWPFWPTAGVVYFIFATVNLIRSFGKKIPYIELTMVITILQVIISPILEYHLFQNAIFGVMKVSEPEYLSFVIPATLLFHLGLVKGVGRTEILFSDKRLEVFTLNRQKYLARGKFLIFTGIIFSVIAKFALLPAIGFILVLLSLLQFLGFFYLWLSQSKHLGFYFILVFVPFLIQAMSSTIFIDVIVWGTFLYSFYLIKNKVSIPKLSFIAVFSFSFLVIFQSVKYDYRKEVWNGAYSESSAISKMALLGSMMYKRISGLNKEEMKFIGSVVNVRFNQGWIISDVMKNMDEKSEYVGFKYLGPELMGILLPRFLYPNKIRTDDNSKFTEFAGWKLSKKVAMDLGIAGDAYGAFGYKGGILFCGLVGLLFGLLFKFTNQQVKKHPDIFIFNMVIFFYLMRAGNEFYIITNWIVKAGIFTWVILLMMNNQAVRTVLFRPKLSQLA